MEPRTISASPDVTFATTTARQTPTPPRAAKFGEVLSNTVVKSAESAMSMLPGSPMMALAVRSATGTAAASIPLASGSASGGLAIPSSIGGMGASGSVTGASSGVTGASSATGVSGATGTTGTDGAGIESSLQQSQEMNLYYLQVQETVNQQNRSFTTFSNVMKAQHDTVKNAIGNIR